MNKKLKFRGLRVYGLLTDLLQFKFYSYNPPTETFCFDETLLVEIRRTKSLSDMVDGLYIHHYDVSVLTYLPSVADKIFSVILTAYIDGLSAIVKMSKDRAEHNDVSPLATPKLHISDVALVFIKELGSWNSNGAGHFLT